MTKEEAVQWEIKKEKWDDIGRVGQCCGAGCGAATESKVESIQGRNGDQQTEGLMEEGNRSV